MRYGKLPGMPQTKANVNGHTIKSHNVLCEMSTGRVVAVFYNDYDLDNVIKQMERNSILSHIEKFKVESVKLITESQDIHQKSELLDKCVEILEDIIE